MKKILILGFYLLIGIGLFFPLLTSRGVLLGGDWGFPATQTQMDVFLTRSLNTWADSLLGERNLSMPLLPLLLPMYFLSSVGVAVDFIPKLLVLFIFVFSGFSFFLLLRHFKISLLLSFFGGLFYSTTPIFFNYLLVGWTAVLITAGLIPLGTLFFIKAVEENKIKYLAALAITFLFTIQSQSVLWILMIWFFLAPYLVRDKSSCIRFLLYFICGLAVFVLINAYWLLGMLVVSDPRIVSSDLVKSAVSLGTVAHFSPLNMVRMFGSLYNFQFESIINKSPLFPLSFIIPLLAILALIFFKNRRLVLSFCLIGISPLIFYLLNFDRELFQILPFANVFRDFSRFSVLSSFAFPLLAIIFLSILPRKGTLIIIFLWFLSIFPWWTGELTNWENSSGQDIRFRTKVLSADYYDLENQLAQMKTDDKALYFPIGEQLEFQNDSKFQGGYRSAGDVFASYSPLSSYLYINDRNMGYSDRFGRMLAESSPDTILNLLEKTNVRYFILRKDVNLKEKSGIVEGLKRAENTGLLKKYLETIDLIVYTREGYFPHFYIPVTIASLDGATETLPYFYDFMRNSDRLGVYFSNEEAVGSYYVFPKQKGKIVSDLIDINKKYSFSPSVFLSQPGSPEYQLAELLDLFKKRQAGNDPDQLFDYYLGLATKFIWMMVDYPVPSQAINLEDKYKKAMDSAFAVLKRENFPSVVIFGREINNHRRKIEAYSLKAEKEKIRGIIKQYVEKLNEFSRLAPTPIYEFNIPQGGDYQVFLQKDSNIPWQLFSNNFFSVGPQMINIPTELIGGNLISEGGVKIKEYLPNSYYRLSFSYNSSDNWVGIKINEKNGRKILEEALPPTGQGFEYYEGFFKSSALSESAYLILPPKGIKDVEVRRVYQPKVLIKKTENIQNSLERPKIFFQKVSPVKYKVRVTGATSSFSLFFSESFHSGWKLYLNPNKENYTEAASYLSGEVKEAPRQNIFFDKNTLETLGLTSLEEKSHFVASGYINSWIIDPAKICMTKSCEIDLIVEFWPQRLFYLGLVISGLTLMASFVIMLVARLKK